MVDHWQALEWERSKLRNELKRIGIRPLSIKVCDYGHAWAVRTEHGTASLPVDALRKGVDLEHQFYCANCHCLVKHGFLSLRYALRFSYSFSTPCQRKFLEVAICETCADLPSPELERTIKDMLRLRRHWDAWASRIESELRAEDKSCE